MPPGPKANPLFPEVRSGQVWELGILKAGEKMAPFSPVFAVSKEGKPQDLSKNKILRRGLRTLESQVDFDQEETEGILVTMAE